MKITTKRVRFRHWAAVAAVALAATTVPAAAQGTPAGHLNSAMPMSEHTYLYVWAGAVGRVQADRLITLDYDPTSPKYGQMVAQTPIPAPNSAGNEPHHCGISMNYKMVVCGGLMSPAVGHDWLFYFDISNPAKPVFMKAGKSPIASYPDDFIAQSNNGFVFTEMGSSTGKSPGRIAKMDASGRIVGEYPANPPTEFNPHGIAARTDLDLLVTCDYVEPMSTLNTTPGPLVFRSSVEFWSLSAMTITKRIMLPKDAVTMDCKLLHHDPNGLGYVGGSGNGHLYLFNAKAGTVQDVYDVTKLAPGAMTEYMQISNDDTRLYVPYQSASNDSLKNGLSYTNGLYSGVAVFDITNPVSPRLVQDFKLPAYSAPHMSMLMGNQYLVTDYFVEQDSIGKLHGDGDHFVRSMNVDKDGKLSYDTRFQVDFNKLIPGLQLRPHGAVSSNMYSGMDMGGTTTGMLTGTATCSAGLANLTGTAGAGHLIQIRDAAWNIKAKVTADTTGKWTAQNVAGLCANNAKDNVILEEATGGKRVNLTTITAANSLI